MFLMVHHSMFHVPYVSMLLMVHHSMFLMVHYSMFHVPYVSSFHVPYVSMLLMVHHSMFLMVHYSMFHVPYVSSFHVPTSAENSRGSSAAGEQKLGKSNNIMDKPVFRIQNDWRWIRISPFMLKYLYIVLY